MYALSTYTISSVPTCVLLLYYFFLVIAGYPNHSKNTTSKNHTVTVITTLNLKLTTKAKDKTDDKNTLAAAITISKLKKTL